MSPNPTLTACRHELAEIRRTVEALDDDLLRVQAAEIVGEPCLTTLRAAKLLVTLNEINEQLMGEAADLAEDVAGLPDAANADAAGGADER